MKKLMSYIIPILILFFIANFAIFISGLEVWLNWNFATIIVLFIVIMKYIFIVAITAGLLKITNFDEHPLVVIGLVFSFFIIYENQYPNYLLALDQKTNYGKEVEIKASELHLHKNLYKTPYIKILNSRLDEIKSYKRYYRDSRPIDVYTTYCYANILNTKEPTLLIKNCLDDGLKDLNNIKEQAGKNGIVALALPKRYDIYKFRNSLQFRVAPKTFEDFYIQREKAFFKFIKIVNYIALAFSLIFIIFKKYI